MTETAAAYDPARFHRVFVADQSLLAELVPQLARASALGVDLEMAQRPHRLPGGYQEWVQVLALIQIASDDLSVVIDPLRCHDLSPLRSVMGGALRKVFLGGGQDAALLERSGIPARNVVDVGEVALAIFGRRQDGMAALADRIFGLSLDKTVRRADWLARPLNPALLAYAHRDAELTLLIYQWLREHYPEMVALHQRKVLEPDLPASTPEWLREAASRSQTDPLAILMERSLDPARDAARLSRDVRQALRQSRSPRQTNRLLRVAGDLNLRDLLPDIVLLADSPLSLLRAAAARVMGQLADPETGGPVLQRLRQDPVEDVKRAAEAALRELRAPPAPLASQEDEPAPSLNDAARSTLAQLLQQLQDEAG